MVLVQSIVLRHAAASSVLVAVVKVDVPWIYIDALLKIIRAYLVGAARLAVDIRAVVAMLLSGVIHVDVDAHFGAAAVLGRVALLR